MQNSRNYSKFAPLLKRIMRVLKSIGEIQPVLESLRRNGSAIGLVPTMGALHEGHLAIVRRANDENETAVVSIFVNPTQFNDTSDLDKYPRNLQQDLDLLAEISEDIIVFVPEVSEMYSEGIASKKYDFNGLETEMEGEFRPGHFQGVATIVEKLLKILMPDRAYFGEKDYQQLQIIRKLVVQTGLPIEIIGCPIVRESSGLAMSSRNKRLSKRLRKEASFIFKTLKTAKVKFGIESAKTVVDWVNKEFKNHRELELEYFVIADDRNLKPIINKENRKKYRAFIAVYAEGIRLIDNVALN